MPAPAERLDLLPDAPRFLGTVPDADHTYLLSVAGIGPECLAESAGILCDEPVRGGQDVRCRTVVLLQSDDLCAGEVLLELEDVGHLGTAPGVDGLIVVADAAHVAAWLRQQLEP